jgi:hypothetical protein
MGHPGRTIRTPGRKQAFIRLLRKGNTIGAAAAAIGCDRRTMYDWRADDPVFRAQWEDALEFQTEEIESVVYKKAKAGDLLACCIWLRAHKPALYHRRQLVQLTGDVDLTQRTGTHIELDERGAPIEVINNIHVAFRMPPNHRDEPEVLDAKDPPLIEGEASDDDKAA